MLKPSLQLKLGQTLTMTPQLQQAIRLLQLPVLDLNAQIQEALEENIMLEMEDLPDVPRTSAESTAEVETIKADEAWQTRAAERIQDSGWNGEGRPITEFADESGQSLRDHLLARIGLKDWEIEAEDRPPANLVFLIDVSGSMKAEDFKYAIFHMPNGKFPLRAGKMLGMAAGLLILLQLPLAGRLKFLDRIFSRHCIGK